MQPQTLLRNYTYGSNNPTSITDPSGLYGDDVHVDMTHQYVYALAVLLAPNEDPALLANLITEGDINVDRSHALWSAPTWVGGCTECHFCDRSRTLRHANEALTRCNPFLFGASLHQLQDFFSHWNEGYTWQHALDYRRSGGNKGRPPDKIADFFEGEHCFQGEYGLECYASPYEPHLREEVRADLAARNPALNMDGLSDDDLINLYLRADGDHVEERSYFGLHTDKSFMASAREEEMRSMTVLYVIQFMLRISSSSCQCATSQPIPDDATVKEFLRQ